MFGQPSVPGVLEPVYETADGTVENKRGAGVLKLQPPAPAFVTFRYIIPTGFAASITLARTNQFHFGGAAGAEPGARPAAMHAAHREENREQAGEYTRRRGTVCRLAIVHGARFHQRLIYPVVIRTVRPLYGNRRKPAVLKIEGSGQSISRECRPRSP